MMKPLRLLAPLLGLVILGGCQSILTPDRTEPVAVSQPLWSEVSIEDASEAENTTAASDTTGRSGVYIGSGH